MNSTKIIALLEDGAVFNANESKIYHPSFRNGSRKLMWSDISWQAAMRKISGRLVDAGHIYTLTVQQLSL